ncbi:efflux RND transporter periplasmic adaptor subunit [Aestuariirhabdus sp. Z084]|uniref:efflux RND transporter periplasmic adaptor subunit n=1 Tax=Aestuariirhabdus haliotis TaxID=2918751 RepID=UPI00201B415C|nr:efflux RND transporter periplasmic adaptor subunit [Aestuariirhabdus haliotis]MCL6414333.1 efflux RND transporter periplasmic adaptor subunit [Aestuariirhabdus haliotis]MCL6418265.1 efflux RND transporter periplasmic adaptor subunit [Aestuariirhabdus haliotis]
MLKSAKTWAVAVSLPLLLIGCGKEEQAAAPEVIRPVKTVVVTSPETANVRVFPGVIDAAQKVDSSFRISGKLQELLVREGDQIEKGQVIAKLDPTDYQITERDRQARYQEAKANFERAAQLLPQGHISKADYDRLDATYKSADAALAEARQDLAYTTLLAPFSGRVAQRLVENFQEIQAKQPIIELQDTSSLEVKVDIPEGDIKRLRADGATPTLEARFGPADDQIFPLEIKEYSTVADAKTQTFRVTLAMETPSNFTVLPGMTTSVLMNMNIATGKGRFVIPVSAVRGDVSLQPEVWIVQGEEGDMSVTSRMIEVSTMSSIDIGVLKGLNEGDRIVTAGVAFLVEGQKVRLLEEIEQAEPEPEAKMSLN